MMNLLFDARFYSQALPSFNINYFCGAEWCANCCKPTRPGRHRLPRHTFSDEPRETLILLALTVLLTPFQSLIGVALAMAFGQLVTLLMLVSFLIHRLAEARV